MNRGVHINFMHRALELAEQGRGWVEPNPMVGAVLVKGDRIIGEGWHRRFGEPHAEVEAIADARKRGEDPTGATLYVTLEPCAHHGKTPPCVEAISDAGIARVVIATPDPHPHAKGGADILRERGVTLESDCCEKEARALDCGFFAAIEQGRPFVCVKVAVSADNKLTRKQGTRTQISGTESHEYLHELRARYGAILVGANTVLIDNPRLTARPANWLPWMQQPVRVVLDAHGRIPPTANVFSDRHCLVLATTAAPQEKIEALKAKADVAILPNHNRRIPFSAILSELASRNVHSILIEGGANVLTQCLEERVADQWIIVRSPETFGSGLDFITEPKNLSTHFQKKRSVTMGIDTLEIYAPA